MFIKPLTLSLPACTKEFQYSQQQDKYYTKRSLARGLYQSLLQLLEQYEVDLSGYTWIEPSAGDGAFSDLLPENKIAMDIAPGRDDITKQDFLAWSPEKEGKYIVIGNPPFGRYGKLALEFINRAAQYADIVAFIVPANVALTENTCQRISLVHREKVAADGFDRPDNKPCEIYTMWQVWMALKDKPSRNPVIDVSEYCDIVNINSFTKKPTDPKLESKCRYFLRNTYYKDASAPNNKPGPVMSIKDMDWSDGYGIIPTGEQQCLDMLNVFANTKWNDVAHRATNGSLHINRKTIKKVLFDAGMGKLTIPPHQPELFG